MAATTLECDVLVVGGGINGAGIARDLAGRGWTTILCEKDDLASHTSSASTKLIHGGLRYLEQYAFGLVRKALIEREVLLRCAPHVIWPLEFILPQDPAHARRPAWLVRAGLLLYDALARRQLLSGSRAVSLRAHPAGAPLQARFTRGFSYADGWVDDARLVVLNAVDAAERGATVLTRTACTALARLPDTWQASLAAADGASTVVRARCVVNATGPWASRFLTGVAGVAGVADLAGPAGAPSAAPGPGRTHDPVRLVKGSHIVVRRLFAHASAYLFQHPDGRVIFAIPYEQDFTLIGTTDVDFDGDLDRVAIDREEIAYLCTAASDYFLQPVRPQDVVWSYAGVRPLQGEGGAPSDVSRDYRLQLDAQGAPLLNVFGGKLTTYRRLAEEAADAVGQALGSPREHWTAGACLPGGDLYGPVPGNRAVREFDAWVAQQARRHPWLPAPLLQRYARAYGTRIDLLLGQATSLAALGVEILPGLHAAEVAYLVRHEWALCADDILWRRTKRGLHQPDAAAAAEKLDAWLTLHHSGVK